MKLTEQQVDELMGIVSRGNKHEVKEWLARVEQSEPKEEDTEEEEEEPGNGETLDSEGGETSGSAHKSRGLPRHLKGGGSKKRKS